jgi:hypothetical protein
MGMSHASVPYGHCTLSNLIQASPARLSDYLVCGSIRNPISSSALGDDRAKLGFGSSLSRLQTLVAVNGKWKGLLLKPGIPSKLVRSFSPREHTESDLLIGFFWGG